MIEVKKIDSKTLVSWLDTNWNTAYDKQEKVFDNFKIIQIRRVAKGCLSYIIASENEEIVKEIADIENWQIKYVTDTHIHATGVNRCAIS